MKMIVYFFYRFLDEPVEYVNRVGKEESDGSLDSSIASFFKDGISFSTCSACCGDI